MARFLDIAGADPAATVVDQVPPSGARCTMEKLAINAVMAGAPPESLVLLVAALRAMSAPDFELHSLNATTGSVVPLVLVNGPIRRHRLGLPCEAGCLGGVAGPAPSIGRALRLVMRNVAGQQIGVTSQSTFGQPGRVAGVCDVLGQTGDELLTIIGRSMAVLGANGFLTSAAFSEVLAVINPVWAEVIARDVPDVEEVQQRLWALASLRIGDFPPAYHEVIVGIGRLHGDHVHLVQHPSQVLVAVAGGLGSLHATVIHSWGATTATTAPVEPLSH